MEESMARFVRCLIAIVAAACAPLAASQAWPVKPIRLIVNFPAGGTTDQMARAFAPRLSETLG
jgi:tripartite-type tricarboxylate transporter receptor subunit TctC